ncbi:phosphopyruvate hydratase [Mycoplasma sp. SG1]|uniref:phosphopyruvate hydratase n=1 Tax=Mycoplasma sp. SG1 TaxID=2810348 RepID=UPI002025B5B4|nr:phosphopyruvate hydratase [Mycoplasma sp. SG1]URM52766.1 phosphopyruvate hydratase [Mycoplasma sp. SG1]
MSKIIDIKGRQVLDSRGTPTVEVEILTEMMISATAIVPSGASTGEKEAYELRDNDPKYFNGKSVLKAVENVNTIIKKAILENEIYSENQEELDNLLIKLDGTKNKSKLGANAILAVSMAAAKVSAMEQSTPLYKYLGGVGSNVLPIPFLNVINGGAHADNIIDFQEFMIVPTGAKCFSHAMEMAYNVYNNIKKILKNKGLSTNVGDEGGFAPNLESIEHVLDILVEAIKMSGYNPKQFGKNAVAIALDVAASELNIKSGPDTGKYLMKKLSKKHNKNIIKTSDEMIAFYETLINKYPVVSIEDGLGEHDWAGFEKLNKAIGNKVQIVGDDLFVTNPKLIVKGIENKAANSVLIKINQIGTITETIQAINLAKKYNMSAMISHRSGETEDTFIADLAVAFNTGQIKTGAMSRSERIAKFNRLLRIEESLDKSAHYLGLCGCAFYNLKDKDLK